MSTLKPSNVVETSLTQDLIYAIRYYLGGRRGLILLIAAALGIGAALNWSWLIAIGVAPLILAVAPCAIMCGLGLCMNKAKGRSCAAKPEAVDQSEPGGQAMTAHAVDANAGVDTSKTITPTAAKISGALNRQGSNCSDAPDERKS